MVREALLSVKGLNLSELLDGGIEKQLSSLRNCDLYQNIKFQTSLRIVLVVSCRVDLEMD